MEIGFLIGLVVGVALALLVLWAMIKIARMLDRE